MSKIPSPKEFLGAIVGIFAIVAILNALVRHIQTFGGGSGIFDFSAYVPMFTLTLEFLIPGASIGLGLVYLLTRDSGF